MESLPGSKKAHVQPKRERERRSACEAGDRPEILALDRLAKGRVAETFLALALLGMLTGCGGAAPMPDTAPAAPEAPESPSSADAPGPSEAPYNGEGADPAESEEVERQQEVERLVSDIESLQQQIGAKTITDSPPTGPTSCQKVCELKEAICASSSKICDIADRTPTESYFANRCDWATEQCGEAKERCDGCVS